MRVDSRLYREQYYVDEENKGVAHMLVAQHPADAARRGSKIASANSVPHLSSR